MTLFDKIKEEIMADTMNAHYTRKGMSPLFKASKNARIVIVGQAPKYLPLVHPSPLNIGWFKRNPWFENEVLLLLKEIVRNALSK